MNLLVPDQTLLGPDGQPLPVRPPLVVVVGRARSGKDTIGGHLAERHGYYVVKLAGALKAMLVTLFALSGDDQQTVGRRIEGDLKEVDHPIFGKSPRHMMQTLGTEWGRDCIKDSMWIDLVLAMREHAPGPVVVTDCRFENEFDLLSAAGGYTVGIERPSLKATGLGLEGETAQHSSEQDIDALVERCDEKIMNDSDLFDLKRKVDRRHNEWRK